MCSPSPNTTRSPKAQSSARKEKNLANAPDSCTQAVGSQSDEVCKWILVTGIHNTDSIREAGLEHDADILHGSHRGESSDIRVRCVACALQGCS